MKFKDFINENVNLKFRCDSCDKVTTHTVDTTPPPTAKKRGHRTVTCDHCGIVSWIK